MTQTRRLLFAILLIAFSGGCWLAANAQQPTVTVRDGETIHDALKRDTLTGKSTLELKSDKQQPTATSDVLLKLPTKKTLTPEQIKRWGELTDFEKAQAERHGQAIGAAVNTPVGELSREVHAAVQSTWLALNLARSQKAEWLANLRAEAGCPRCVIVGDTLTEGK